MAGGMTLEALPDIGAVRIRLDAADWVGNPEPAGEMFGQLLRTIYPPGDPRYFTERVKVRIRAPTALDNLRLSPSPPPAEYGSPWEYIAGAVDVWYDTEAPLDVPVWYIVEMEGYTSGQFAGTGFVNLVPNPEFETGIGGWAVDGGGSISHETVAPLFGNGSIKITVVGSPTFTGTRPTPRVPVTLGHRYQASGWLRSPTGGQCRIGIDWWTAGSVYISTTFNSATIPANVTTYRSIAGTPPPTAAFAEVRVIWSNNPPTGGTLIADRIMFADMGAGDAFPDGTSVVLPSNDLGWLSHPNLPPSDIRLEMLPDDECVVAPNPTGVLFIAHAAESRQGAGARFDVVQQAYPSVTIGKRKAPTSTLTLAALSFADRDRVHDLLAEGTIAMLRLPPYFGVTDRHLDTGDLTTSALSPDLRLPYRVLDLPYASSASPSGPVGGVLGVRYQDLDRYPTWTAFDAAGLTSIDLLMGAGSTVGVGA